MKYLLTIQEKNFAFKIHLIIHIRVTTTERDRKCNTVVTKDVETLTTLGVI